MRPRSTSVLSIPRLPRAVPLALAALSTLAGAASARAADACTAVSARVVPTVVELYTSEGCSSCPPADKWLSAFKEDAAKGRVVAQAFHVGYWDYIGWI
ncbi:MAG: DUF1223 domain-containing protein, partial [Rhizobacter sp.]|nr:DUF1223 domain-containing protein [Rhizobacter sp.]